MSEQQNDEGSRWSEVYKAFIESLELASKPVAEWLRNSEVAIARKAKEETKR